MEGTILPLLIKLKLENITEVNWLEDLPHHVDFKTVLHQGEST